MTVSASIGWPAATTPRAPLRATIARIIFEHAVQRIPVRVTYPDGRVLGGGSGTSPEFRLLRPHAFFARLGRDAKVGAGSVVLHNVPPRATVAGVPARIVGWSSGSVPALEMDQSLPDYEI